MNNTSKVPTGVARTAGSPAWVAYCLLLMLLWPAQSWGISQAEWVQTSRQVQHFEDLRPQLGALDWRPTTSDRALNFGINNRPVWLRFEVPPENTSRVLEIAYPVLDHVDVYWVQHDKVIASLHTGDQLPFAQRALQHRHFAFPLPRSDEPMMGYVRVQTEGSLQIPWRITLSADFLADDQVSYGLQTIFTGAMMALALFNLLILLVVRDAAYGWYVLSIVSNTMVQLTMNGLTFQWLWPAAPEINNIALVLFLSSSLVFVAGFTNSFLRLRHYGFWIAIIPRIIIVTGSMLFVAAFILPYNAALLLVILAAFVASPLMFFLGVYSWWRGNVLARIYTAAWGVLLVGYTLQTLSKMALLPRTTWVEYSPQVGLMLEAVLLSFALAYRINLERRARLAAQEEALMVQREANQMLEARVAERTLELELVNERLKAMTLTDGLTKIANRRRFDELLAMEWRRCARHQQSLSLFLMDIDYFKRVNDTLGHPVGDQCLIAVAAICDQLMAREGDLAARYGGEEFAVLLPGTDEQGAYHVAERLRQVVADSPVTVAGLDEPVKLTVSIGLASMVPVSGVQPESLVHCADQALYAAKAAGRNQVQVFQDQDLSL